MKLKKLLAAVTTGVLAVTSLSLSGLVSSAEVQELMNDTFESGYGAWKGVGSSLSLSTEQSHSGGAQTDPRQVCQQGRRQTVPGIAHLCGAEI